MRNILTGILVGVFAIAGIAIGKDSFKHYIPNVYNDCQTCHVGRDGGDLNVFGNDVKLTLKNGKPDWKALFNLDSDGDGATNGEELGDPNGTWNVSDPNPSGTVTNPADPQSKSTRPLAIQRVQVPTTWAVIKALFR